MSSKQRFQELKTREEQLKARVSSMQGSIQVLKGQYREAVATLEAKFGISPDQLENELERAGLEMQNLVSTIEAELDAYDKLMGGSQDV